MVLFYFPKHIIYCIFRERHEPFGSEPTRVRDSSQPQTGVVMTQNMDPELRTLRTALLLNLGTLPIMYPDCPYAVFQQQGIEPKNVPEEMLARAMALLSNPDVIGHWHEWLQMAVDLETEDLAKAIEAEANELQGRLDSFQARKEAFLTRLDSQPNRPLASDETEAVHALLQEAVYIPFQPLRIMSLLFLAGICRIAYDPRKPAADAS